MALEDWPRGNSGTTIRLEGGRRRRRRRSRRSRRSRMRSRKRGREWKRMRTLALKT